MTLWEVTLSIFWFMILLAWIMLLVSIITDIFRDHELSGWAKALWTLFLIVLPWLGALVYLIARGSAMNERAREHAQRRYREYGGFTDEAARSAPTSADELTKLADLRDRGAISPEEFQRAKASVLGEAPTTGVEDRRASVSPA
jgi:hypothetical protein